MNYFPAVSAGYLCQYSAYIWREAIKAKNDRTWNYIYHTWCLIYLSKFQGQVFFPSFFFWIYKKQPEAKLINTTFFALLSSCHSLLLYTIVCVQFLSLMLELLLWQKPCRSVSQEKGNSLAKKKISVESYKSSPHYHLQRFLQGYCAIELKQNQWHSHGTNLSPKAFSNFT